MFERGVERPDAIRQAGQIWMHSDMHDAPGCGAFTMEGVELPAGHCLGIAGIPICTFDRLFIVDVVAVGQRYYRFAVAQRHGVGLVIVGAPVRNILAARRNEVIERIPGLLQSGAEPTYGPLSAPPRGGIERSADDLSLILRLHFIEADGIAPVMAHPFPAPLLTLLDDLGMMHADMAVEAEGGGECISV